MTNSDWAACSCVTVEVRAALASLVRVNVWATMAAEATTMTAEMIDARLKASVKALADRLAARGVPMLADPKRSPFRIYRDTRFSKDKSPYKAHLGATFPWIEDAPGAYVKVQAQ